MFHKFQNQNVSPVRLQPSAALRLNRSAEKKRYFLNELNAKRWGHDWLLRVASYPMEFLRSHAFTVTF